MLTWENLSSEPCCWDGYLMLARVVPLSCSCAANLRSAASALWGAETAQPVQALGAAVPTTSLLPCLG